MFLALICRRFLL